MKGALFSAVLPLLGASAGYYQLLEGVKKAEAEVPGCDGEISKYTAVSSIMLAVCAVYGFVGAFVISTDLAKEPALPENSAFAAGLVNGLASAMSAVGQGFFAAKAVEAGARSRQTSSFAAFVLILIYIEAFALYGLVDSLVIGGVALESQVDIHPGTVMPFTSVFLLATLGGVVGSAVSGYAIMEIVPTRPDLAMKAMIPVVFNGVTGIYGLINGVVDTQPWPPTANDWAAGLLYLLSSVGLSYYGYTGVKALLGPHSLIEVIGKLTLSQSVGLLGLIYGLLKHSK
ncbi:VAP, partial [Symbiodinium sp. KB8]